MPTTVQAYSRRVLPYVRNAVRRGSPGNLWRFIVCGRGRDWDEAAESLVERALTGGGVFHLWGHSWELEETRQWQRLEKVLQFLGTVRDMATAMTNSEVCAASARRRSDDVRPVAGATGAALGNL